MKRLVTIAGMLVAGPAVSGVTLAFVESAPKDRFIIQNTGDCASQATDVTIDLGPSAGKLIFDTTVTGAGVEVFQPFEVVAGGELLTSSITPLDGDSRVVLQFSTLPIGASFAFTIDVDDTLPASSLGQIRVAGSEIAGAVFEVNGQTAVMDQTGRAEIALACLS